MHGSNLIGVRIDILKTLSSDKYIVFDVLTLNLEFTSRVRRDIGFFSRVRSTVYFYLIIKVYNKTWYFTPENVINNIFL